MGTFQRISFNILASYGGRVVGSFLGLVSIGLITRALGREGFGEYATVLAYLGTFQILADLGLYTLLTREISQNSEREKNLVSSFFTLRLVVAAFFLLVAVGLVFLFPYSYEVKLGVALASFAFLSMSLTQILMGVFQKYLQTYKNALAEVLGRLAQLGLVWFFFHTQGGFHHYIGALVAGSIVIFVVNLFFARRLVPFRLAVLPTQWKHILRTAFPIAVSLVFTLLYFKMDTIFLSLLKSQEDVGIYNVAYKVLETLIFFPAVFVGLLFPIFSKYAQQNREKFSKLLSSTTNLMTLAALPTVVGGVLLSSTIVSFIGGAEFLISAFTLKILFVAVGVIFYGTLFGSSVIALGLQRKAMWVYGAGFAFNFLTNLIFIPRYSYLGAAWTTVATEILVTVALVWLVRRAIPFRISLAATAKTALAAVLMGGVVFYFAAPMSEPLSAVKFLGLVLVGALLYLFFSFVLKTIKPTSAFKDIGL